MAAAKKKKKTPWMMGASSGHITNLMQSILETFDIYGRDRLVIPAADWAKMTSLGGQANSTTGLPPNQKVKKTEELTTKPYKTSIMLHLLV
jgi:hypothetical protein